MLKLSQILLHGRNRKITIFAEWFLPYLIKVIEKRVEHHIIFKHSNGKSEPTVLEVRMRKVHLAVDPKAAVVIYAPKCKPKLQMKI